MIKALTVTGCTSWIGGGDRCALCSGSAAKGDLCGRGDSVSIVKVGDGEPEDSLQDVRARANRAASPAAFSSALMVIS